MRDDSHDSPRGKPSAESAGDVPDQALAESLGTLARQLQSEDDTETMLDELVRSAVALIPGTDEGSISVVLARREVSSYHGTSALPNQVDAVQSELGEGPCLDAAFEQQTVRVDDMAAEQRWPRFSRRALELGARGMLAFQLYVEGDNLGALNLYSRRPRAFDDESEQIGLLFATHAAVAFANAQRVDQLGRAIASRDLIGQAKGILMERFQIEAAVAFRVLSRVSQQRNVKLRDVAEELVRTGHLMES
ncbi:GAF and ANTAR domain-containing protein [Desertihabitans brevis]|uniref:GAF and ANTAR domain-containing protein n=1 Tax=Desertihabitans brevis TaxID=2268447 RepID=UPI0018F35059|nr:GAF and ANTAR domain-containing protein [Desertihabitans brevis]